MSEKKQDKLYIEKVYDFINLLKTIKEYSIGIKIKNGRILQTIDGNPSIIYEYKNDILQDMNFNLKPIPDIYSYVKSFKKTNKTELKLDNDKLVFINGTLEFNFENVADRSIPGKFVGNDKNFVNTIKKLFSNLDKTLIVNQTIPITVFKQISSFIGKLDVDYLSMCFSEEESPKFYFKYFDYKTNMDIQGIKVDIISKDTSILNTEWLLPIDVIKMIKNMPSKSGINMKIFRIDSLKLLMILTCHNEEIGSIFKLYSGMRKKEVKLEGSINDVRD